MLSSLHVGRFLLWREQIKKQRRESVFVECTRHKLIPWTVTAAAAAVCKKNEGGRVFGNIQISGENCAPGTNLDFAHLLRLPLILFFCHVQRRRDISKRLSLRIRDSSTAVGMTKRPEQAKAQSLICSWPPDVGCPSAPRSSSSRTSSSVVCEKSS